MGFRLERVYCTSSGDVVHFQTHQVNYMLPYLPGDINKLKTRAVRSKCDGSGSIRYLGETCAS